jgi:hypothetical protein
MVFVFVAQTAARDTSRHGGGPMFFLFGRVLVIDRRSFFLSFDDQCPIVWSRPRGIGTGWHDLSSCHLTVGRRKEFCAVATHLPTIWRPHRCRATVRRSYCGSGACYDSYKTMATRSSSPITFPMMNTGDRQNTTAARPSVFTARKYNNDSY